MDTPRFRTKETFQITEICLSDARSQSGIYQVKKECTTEFYQRCDALTNIQWENFCEELRYLRSLRSISVNFTS